MDKMGYARGLIRYSTENAMDGKYREQDIVRRVLRPRTLVYAVILLAITGATVAAMVLRNPLKVDIIRDRGVLAREAGPGVVENVYRIQIMNTDETPRRFRVSAEGLPGLEVVGVEQPVVLGGAQTRLLPMRLQAPVESEAERGENVRRESKALEHGAHKIEITVQAVDDEKVVRHEKSSFIVPR